MSVNWSSDTFHNSTPALSASIIMNDDGSGSVTHGGPTSSSGYYNYHLVFYATNDENNSDFSDMEIIANYYGHQGGQTDTGTQNFTLPESWRNQTIYFWYGCYNSWSGLSPLADSGFLTSGSIDYLQAPTLGYISLRWQKDGDSSVSNNTSEIGITLENIGGGAYDTMYTWIEGPGKSDNRSYTNGDYFNNHYDLFTGLSPRTTYTFYAQLSNSAGYSDKVSATFRTLSNKPSISFDPAETHTLNSVTISWKSDISLSEIKYQMQTTESWVDYNDNNWGNEQSIALNGGTTSSVTFYTEPNTRVHIKSWGIENYDGISGDTIIGSGTTYDKASLSNLEDNIQHNNGAISISISNPSNNNLTLKVLNGSNEIHTENVSSAATSFSLSESEWDSIYRLYGNDNSKSYTVELITDADSGHSPSSYSNTYDRTITLTGIQKTAHVGHSGPKRAMVYCGKDSGVKHAVVWVGKSGPKRTI